MRSAGTSDKHVSKYPETPETQITPMRDLFSTTYDAGFLNIEPGIGYITMQYVYLIREREFLNSDAPIYKIGKTIQDPIDRMKGYPKGSELVVTINVKNCHAQENTIIKIFKNEFLQRKDIGREYFEGDVDRMKDIIKNIDDTEGGFTEYQELQRKAKEYGIKANLSKKALAADIDLIEKGKGYKISKDHIRKNNTNFFVNHKKKLGGSAVALLLLIGGYIILVLNHSNGDQE